VFSARARPRAFPLSRNIVTAAFASSIASAPCEAHRRVRSSDEGEGLGIDVAERARQMKGLLCELLGDRGVGVAHLPRESMQHACTGHAPFALALLEFAAQVVDRCRHVDAGAHSRHRIRHADGSVPTDI
jgi:hypothetical protein